MPRMNHYQLIDRLKITVTRLLRNFGNPEKLRSLGVLGGLHLLATELLKLRSFRGLTHENENPRNFFAFS